MFVDPLPAPAPLHAPAPISSADRFRHASSPERPSRVLVETGKLSPGVPLALLPGSVAQFHRNNASDGLTVNATLSQQGLASLVATTPDWWQDVRGRAGPRGAARWRRPSNSLLPAAAPSCMQLQFGFALDSGSGPALNRSSPTTLSSTQPAVAFSLRATAVAVQVWEWSLLAVVPPRNCSPNEPLPGVAPYRQTPLPIGSRISWQPSRRIL